MPPSDVESVNPYESPSAEAEMAVRYQKGSLIGFVDQSPIVLLVTLTVGLQALLYLGTIVLGGLGMLELSSPLYFQLQDAFFKYVDQVTQWLFVVSTIPFGIFLVRANNNTRALGKHVSFSPASMVWWYFVPILSMFRPYQGVREVWEASASGRDDSVGTSSLLLVWWGLWVTTMIVGRWVNNIGSNDTEQFVVAMVYSLVLLARAITAMMVVWQLYQRQQNAAIEEVESNALA